MKPIYFIIAVLMFHLFVAEANISISNVVCCQHYPWNGMVDINYEIFGDPNETNIYVYAKGFDNVKNETLELKSVMGDGVDWPVGPGKHRMIWCVTNDYTHFKTSSFSVKLMALPGCPLYLAIDLSEGENAQTYPVEHLSKIPPGGWTDEYKTTKIVFRLIFPGKFMMGSPTDELGRRSDEILHEVTLTKPYYIGVFEITRKQFRLITGTNSHYNSSVSNQQDCQAENYISYVSLRGSSKGVLWPNSCEIDEDSLLGLLRSKTKLKIDLPTEAQWEYACRAGTSTSLNNGKNISSRDKKCPFLGQVGEYEGNTYFTKKHVGSFLPNLWGLYDMHGGVNEICLDFRDSYSTNPITDPVGGENGKRVTRGGSNSMSPQYCRSACRVHVVEQDVQAYYVGARLVILP